MLSGSLLHGEAVITTVVIYYYIIGQGRAEMEKRKRVTKILVKPYAVGECVSTVLADLVTGLLRCEENRGSTLPCLLTPPLRLIGGTSIVFIVQVS